MHVRSITSEALCDATRPDQEIRCTCVSNFGTELTAQQNVSCIAHLLLAVAGGHILWDIGSLIYGRLHELHNV